MRRTSSLDDLTKVAEDEFLERISRLQGGSEGGQCARTGRGGAGGGQEKQSGAAPRVTRVPRTPHNSVDLPEAPIAGLAPARGRSFETGRAGGGWLSAGKGAGYIALRAVICAATSGASEDGFPGSLDIGAGIVETLPLAEYILKLRADDVKGAAVRAALEAGHITSQEAEDLSMRLAECGGGMEDVRQAKQELANAISSAARQGEYTLLGREVMRMAQWVFKCGVCGAAGVNRKSHKKGDPNAGLHIW